MPLRNDIWQWLLAAGFFACLLLAVTGCKTIAQQIPTNVSQRDSVRTEYKLDSIYIDRWHKEYLRGDTLIIHDSIYRDRWHYKHDSIYFQSTDTIYKTVQVEKKSSTFLRNSGIALWVLIALLVLSVIAGLIIKFAK